MAAIAVFTLAGCGGSGGSGSISDGTGVNHFAFGIGADYNGDTGAFNSDTSMSVVSGGHTITTTADGHRTISIDLPADPLVNGTSFAIGGAGGAVVVYSEVHGDVTWTWTGTSGSVQVVSAGSVATLKITTAQFSGPATAGNPAAGTFLLSGSAQEHPVPSV